MKVKITLDKHAMSSRQADALAKVNRELGSKVTIQGDVITVDAGHERKVEEILNRPNVNYSRST
jgi:hypothetical protein